MVDFWIGKCDNDAVHQARQIAAERNHSCHFLNKSPMDDFNKPFQLHLLITNLQCLSGDRSELCFGNGHDIKISDEK